MFGGQILTQFRGNFVTAWLFSIHLTVIGVLSYGGFIVIVNIGMAIYSVQLIMVNLPSISQFAFSFGSLVRNNQLEISNLLHLTRCKKEKMRGFKSSVTVEVVLTHANFPVSNYYHVPNHVILK